MYLCANHTHYMQCILISYIYLPIISKFNKRRVKILVGEQEIRFASRNSIKTHICFRISLTNESSSLQFSNSTKQTDSENELSRIIGENEKERILCISVARCLPFQVQQVQGVDFRYRDVILGRIGEFMKLHMKCMFDVKLMFRLVFEEIKCTKYWMNFIRTVINSFEFV